GDKPVGAFANLPLDELGEGALIERAVFERRDEGGQRAPDPVQRRHPKFPQVSAALMTHTAMKAPPSSSDPWQPGALSSMLCDWGPRQAGRGRQLGERRHSRDDETTQPQKSRARRGPHTGADLLSCGGRDAWR